MGESNVDGGKFDGQDYKVSFTIRFWYFCPDLLKTKQTILQFAKPVERSLLRV